MGRISRSVWAVAALAAVAHVAPYVRALQQTPAGYTFTGNLSASPDFMQYRVWMRQTQLEGPIVSDVFTAAPNGRHLPVALYWVLGSISRATGISPEWTFVILGGVASFGLALLLWLTVARFLHQPAARAWTYVVILLGGGLGGFLVLLSEKTWAKQNPLIRTFLIDPVAPNATPVLDRFRGTYVVQALFDAHFAVFWVVAVAALLSLHSTLRSRSRGSLALTAALFAFAAFAHVHEGLTLLLVAVVVCILCDRRGLVPRRDLVVTAVGCIAAVLLVGIPIAWLFARSGMPAPTWRGKLVPLSVVLIGYPVAFMLLAYGAGRHSFFSTLDRTFLAGWAIACLTILLSGPFYPYPIRGAMTLQIPLCMIAAQIWFESGKRIGWREAAVIVLLLGSTPLLLLRTQFDRSAFNAREDYKWLSQDHVAMTNALASVSTRDDVLVADEAALRWLAPAYPGRHYAGHFFLTPSYQEKLSEMKAFRESSDPAQRASILRRWNARWIFVSATQDVERVAATPGLEVAMRNRTGALLEYSPAAR